ncbi:ribonuclease H1 [Ceratitis capitata]|uniref:ribonuclease H1 n=1 Tax=Ceratitis capitata TaxID=7213 RepID=UPI0003299FCC|nr:ribonuclease H1 [Ceratitis capitata]
MPFYAVAKGRKEGVYTTWAECEQQVKKFSGAIFKKFSTLSQATDFLLEKQKANILLGCLKLPADDELRPAIMQEEPDYIPLQPKMPITNDIKEEPVDTVDMLWFEDVNGDKELLTAIGELKEYPDESKMGVKALMQTMNRNSKLQRVKIGTYIFNVSRNDYIDVYIGGHTENVGNWNCVAGYGVYFGKNHPLNIAEAASGRMTRNVGDIEAAIAAIESAIRVDIPKLCLHTSSEFLLNAVAFWMNNWQRNKWRNKEGKVIQNRKQFEKLYKLLHESPIDITWADARKELCSSKCMKGVQKLAEIGTEEYLDQHPSKDDSFSIECSNFFDFF